MTTLPQNNPMRLPRPSGAPPVLAHPGGPGLAHATPQATQLTAADVWRVVRGNLWLIVLCVAVFAAAGVALNYYLARTSPRATPHESLIPNP